MILERNRVIRAQDGSALSSGVPDRSLCTLHNLHGHVNTLFAQQQHEPRSIGIMANSVKR